MSFAATPTRPILNRWQDLFRPATAGATTRRLTLRVIRRGGQPFLLLPESGPLAARVLELYPAQTPKARLLKHFLRLALQFRCPPLWKREEAIVSADDRFAAFLSECAGTPTLPELGILGGNPLGPGRRFVLLLFDGQGQPGVVVKAGISPEARQLVKREAGFLLSAAARRNQLPEVLAHRVCGDVEAFAQRFVPGLAPTERQLAPLGPTLSGWVDSSREMELREFEQWRRLEAAGALPAAFAAIGTVRCHPALTHGDLAPWNIKVQGARCTVLDWERGEPEGVPAWDWLHLRLQPAVLVKRESAEQLLRRLESLLADPGFQAYAQGAGIAGHERAITLGYLAYCLRVIRQHEGVEQLTGLERAATSRWGAPTSQTAP